MTRLLLTGPYRSGSTALALYLRNAFVAAGGELGLHTTNVFRYTEGGIIADPDGLSANLKRHHDCEAVYTGEAKWVWTGALRRVFDLEDDAPFGEKMQLAWRDIPTFLRWFPYDGKAALLLRDPRSVLASFREYTHAPEPAYLGAAFVCLDAFQCASRLYEHRGQFECVRYEPFARDPLPTLRKTLTWLGLDWPGDDVMLDQSEWPDVPGAQWQDRSSFGDAEDWDAEKAINRWRRHLSDREVLFVETICGPEMRRWGYDTVTDGDMDEAELASMLVGAEQETGWLMRWLETGEGACGFPLPADDPETWAQVEEVA